MVALLGQQRVNFRLDALHCLRLARCHCPQRRPAPVAGLEMRRVAGERGVECRHRLVMALHAIETLRLQEMRRGVIRPQPRSIAQAIERFPETALRHELVGGAQVRLVARRRLVGALFGRRDATAEHQHHHGETRQHRSLARAAPVIPPPPSARRLWRPASARRAFGSRCGARACPSNLRLTLETSVRRGVHPVLLHGRIR